MSESLTLMEWRRARNVSQEKMAELCGVHVNTYRRWENSPGQLRINQVLKIADFLKISLDDIILSTNTTETGNKAREGV